MTVSLICSHIFALIVLVLIQWNMRNCEPQLTLSSRIFFALIVVTMALLVIDIAVTLIEEHAFIGNSGLVVYHVIKICSYFFCEIAEMLWLDYALLRAHYDRIEKVRRSMRIAWVFVLIALVISVSSPWTGLFYSSDVQGGAYTRGPLYFLQGIFGLVYFIWALAVTLNARAKSTTTLERRDFMYLSLFAIPAVIGGFVQIVLSDQMLFWEFVTISVLFIHLADQNRRILTDKLTGCNNRRYFENYLSSLVTHRRSDEHVMVLFIDVDDFKSINDGYGHDEGDRALVAVAGILRRACEGHNCCVTRFGGDEFVIAGPLANPADLPSLVEQIELHARRTSEKLPYDLVLSMGCKEVPVADFDFKSMMSDVDKLMYQAKREHHRRKT